LFTTNTTMPWPVLTAWTTARAIPVPNCILKHNVPRSHIGEWRYGSTILNLSFTLLPLYSRVTVPDMLWIYEAWWKSETVCTLQLTNSMELSTIRQNHSCLDTR
jgi:hypothetical protein